MIKKQALKLSLGLANNNVIAKDSQAVYTYGFELLISAFINILLMIIISIAFRNCYAWILFLASFIPLRTTAGGYHANSHAKCILVTAMSFTILLLFSRLSLDWTTIVLSTAIISLLLILLLSPVEAKNKKLNKMRRGKNRLISIFLGIVNLLIAGIAIFIIEGYVELLVNYFAGVFAAALSMLVAKTVQIYERRFRNEKV